MRLNAANIAAIGTVMAVVVTLLAIVGTGIYQLGTLSNQIHNLSERTAEIEDEMLHNNLRMLHALADHSHDPDGNPVFRTPPGMEPTGVNPGLRTPAQ